MFTKCAGALNSNMTSLNNNASKYWKRQNWDVSVNSYGCSSGNGHCISWGPIVTLYAYLTPKVTGSNLTLASVANEISPNIRMYMSTTASGTNPSGTASIDPGGGILCHIPQSGFPITMWGTYYCEKIGG